MNLSHLFKSCRQLLRLSILILLLVAYSNTLSAESRQDSNEALIIKLRTVKGTEKVEIYLQLSSNCLNADARQALNYSTDALRASEKLADKELIGRCMIQQALAYINLGSYDSAINILNNSQRLIHWPAESTVLARLYTVLGIANEKSGLSDSALHCYNRAYTIYKKAAHYQGIANSYLNIGCLFSRLKKYEEAATYLQKALDESLSNNAGASLGSIYNNLGVVADIRGKKQDALGFYSKALSIQESQGNKAGMAVIYHNMAMIHNGLSQFNQAISCINKSLELKKETGNREGIANAYSLMAEVLMNMNRVNEAEKYILMALEIASAGHYLVVEAAAHKQLAEIYNRQQRFAESSAQWRKAMIISDSLYNQSVSQKLSDMQSMYELKHREQENQILRQEISLQQAREEQQRSYTRFLIFAVAAITIVAILLYVMFRMKVTGMKRSKELFEAEQEIRNLELQNLSTSIQLKNKELTSLSASFISKNEILDQIRKSLVNLRGYFREEIPADLNEIISLVNSNLDHDLNWKKFRMTFDETHPGFLDNIVKAVPDLTLTEHKLCAYLYVGLSSSEIASVMNISLAAVSKGRQRLRKRLGLEINGDICENLRVLHDKAGETTMVVNAQH